MTSRQPSAIAADVIGTSGTPCGSSAASCRLMMPAHAGHRRRSRRLGVVLALKSMGDDDIRVADPNATRLKIAAIVRPPRRIPSRHLAALRIDRRVLRRACRAQSRHRVVLPRGPLVLRARTPPPGPSRKASFRRKDFYMIRTFYFPMGDFAPTSICYAATGKNIACWSTASSAFGAAAELRAFRGRELIKPVLALD